MAESQGQTSDNIVTMQISEPTETNRGSDSMEDAVARLAYELYSGSQDGHDVDDWLNAERELRSGRSATTAV
jgi:hypothetical protein